MPGFTAEESLPTVSTRYQATTAAIFKGEIVQPARFFNCLKKVCRLVVVKEWPRRFIQECNWVPAIC